MFSSFFCFSFQTIRCEATSTLKSIVGMGSAGVDYLAQVANFPMPDEKLRTERLEVQGGGNCGNALTAAVRLGNVRPYIITKIGDDSLGDGIVSEFEREGICTDGILRTKASPSPFTYIIVDRSQGTRTCIHTPTEPFTPDEMTPELIADALDGHHHDDSDNASVSLVYFDGRLAEAALLLARAARKRGIPILVEGERLRPGLDELLQEADYVVTSTGFPKAWTGHSCLGDALVSMLDRLPRVQWIITTLGSQGSVLVRRHASSPLPTGDSMEGQTLINDLFEKLAKANSFSQKVACTSQNGVDIYTNHIQSAQYPRHLHLSTSPEVAVPALVTVASAARLSSSAVVDTTGAGDAFIGSILYCIAMGIEPERSLGLASVVAACKCTQLGARPGLPYGHMLIPSLLA